MKAIVVEKFGSPEALILSERPRPVPLADQALIEIKVCGVNFIDVYFRTGLYKAPLPMILGLEGAGLVSEVGSKVKEVKAGDRVAYTGTLGSYAQFQAVSSERLVKLPDKISFKEGAASMIQGMTAHYLTHSTFPLKKGDSCLIHAAAGGVGLLLCQVARNIGSHVFATVSSEEKAKLANEAGAEHTFIYTKENFVDGIRKITKGKGVNVVYDGVGKDTFEKSLDCLMPRGMMVLFGQSSGPVSPFDPVILNQKGSLFLTRPGITAYISKREELVKRSNDVFHWVMEGKLKIRIGHEFPLEKAKEAHRALEGRKTSGKIILIP